MSMPEDKNKEMHPAPSRMASVSQLPPQHALPGLCAIHGHSPCKDILTADLISIILRKTKQCKSLKNKMSNPVESLKRYWFIIHYLVDTFLKEDSYEVLPEP